MVHFKKLKFLHEKHKLISSVNCMYLGSCCVDPKDIKPVVANKLRDVVGGI